MDLEPTPLRRAALDLAEQVDLCASATGAVCSFTGAGLGARVLLLFPALHPLRLLSTSLFYPKLSAVGFLGAKLVGPMALNVFTLQLFGRALSYRSQETSASSTRRSCGRFWPPWSQLCWANWSCGASTPCGASPSRRTRIRSGSKSDAGDGG
ncbi:unnamed protein product [Effrenium voratum]|nr:unnamed protein product [Effrenium voratum]